MNQMDELQRSRNAYKEEIALATSDAQYYGELRSYYQKLGWKYHAAAAHPWLLVPPDPPEPE